MKKLTLYGLALLLVASTSIAFASDRDNRRHDRHNKHDRHASKHERQYNKHDRHANRHFNSHYNRSYSRHGFRSHRGYQSHHGFRQFRGGHHYRNNYYPSAYLGAALIGSAINYSLHHQHNGVSCYDDHSNDRNRSRDRNYSEVVGCHRIERLADGSERRVEVPRSQCQ